MDDPNSVASMPIDAKPKSETTAESCVEKRSIATAEECLEGLTKLAVLVLLGVVTPAQSNAMCRVYLMLLQHHWRTTGIGAMPVVAKDKLVELLRENPDTAEAFVGLLDSAEIAKIVGGEGDHRDGTETVL